MRYRDCIGGEKRCANLNFWKLVHLHYFYRQIVSNSKAKHINFCADALQKNGIR